MAPDQEMLRLDPESEACFEELREIIAEEINVRVALGNSDPTPENIKLLTLVLVILTLVLVLKKA